MKSIIFHSYKNGGERIEQKALFVVRFPCEQWVGNGKGDNPFVTYPWPKSDKKFSAAMVFVSILHPKVALNNEAGLSNYNSHST